MKKWFLICMAVLMTVLSGCPSPLMYNYHPSAQPGTIWRTKDDTVVFEVREGEPYGYGVIQTEDGPVDIVMSMSQQVTTVGVSYADQFAQREEGHDAPFFAHWHVRLVRRNQFEVVVDTPIYFEEGKVLIFYKDTKSEVPADSISTEEETVSNNIEESFSIPHNFDPKR